MSFVVVLSGTAFAAPPVILVESQIPQYSQASVAVRKYLKDAIEVDPSAAEGDGRVASAPLIVAVGSKALQAARKGAPSKPTVFCMLLGVSPAMLGPTVTGVPLEPDPKTTLSQLQAVSPSVKKVGVVYSEASSGLIVSEAQKAAPGLGLTIVAKAVGAATEVKDAVAQMAGSVDALWLPPDPKLFSKELFNFLLSFSAERKIPLFGYLEGLTQQGALASMSPDYGENGERSGKLAAEILSRPESARIPVPPPVFSPGALSINLKTASALGVTVPPKAVVSAKQVFR